ncbi:F-box protein PP2-A11 [Capsicum annuum]|uniref:F-box protein PP2-A12 n=1 Tax=Capsicum annuum TaxID=4072 RepID=UPI001FB10331|nr:F-box protein PP2-A12 [Capsicum annuum]KAF3664687.1 F-box protein PP2-A11 [Capsicum annuum]KAF3672740.1 F-box protein PP2-A11 [Capsicum annuum]
MGSSFSLLFSPSTVVTQQKTSLGDLPESCVALILVYMDPPQICKLSMLNTDFRAASSADFVWQSKLPINYADIIQRLHNFPHNLCKRDIFARLSRPNSFDGGTKRVWLDKRTGRVCMSISSSGLAITGIDDRRYWSRIETDESRFKSVAYLQQIWWFEVDGEVDFPFPIGSYSIFFRLQVGRASRKFGRRVCNSDHVHGWDKKPVHFQLSTSDGQQATTQCYLNEPGIWKYHHVGDFAVTSLAKEMKVKFSMTQIDCTHTKGGLCVDSVLICPVEFKDRFKQGF